MNLIEGQIVDSNIPPVEEEKTVPEVAAKAPSLPVEVPVKEEQSLPVELSHSRKVLPGAPLLTHSQSLPPLPKPPFKENVIS